MKLACIFPGQGSQKVGMCKDLYDNHRVAKDVFDEVDDALDYKLSQIIFDGPAEELTLTANTQPALMACSIAMLRVLETKLNQKLKEFCSYVAGHSLGEFSALTAAEAMSLSDCARILRVRGEAMQEAVPIGEGAMFALLGANIEVAKAIAKESGCEVANDNSPKQQVLSGTTASIDKAINAASSQGYKAIRLQVSAPFHSTLMVPARLKLAEALALINFVPPKIPVVANISADILAFENIRTNLEKQVTGMVKWCDSIKKLRTLGVTKIVEVGTGRVGSNLNKQIDPEIESVTFDEYYDQLTL